MKKRLLLAILTLTASFYSFGEHTTEQSMLQKKLLQEYFTIAHILKQTTPEKREETVQCVQQLIATTPDPQELYAHVLLLRKTIQEKKPFQINRTIFDATTAYYPPMHGPFDSVWHALTYCGFFCIVYLVMIAIQDNDARKILHTKKTLTELKNRHSCIKNAAASTIAVSRAILTHTKEK